MLPLAVLSQAVLGASSRHSDALVKAREGEDASDGFRAAVFLDDAKAGAMQWHDLGVSLMRLAASGPKKNQNSSPEDAREARRAARCGVWAAAAFELAGRLDPLRLTVDFKGVDDNLKALRGVSADAARLLATKAQGQEPAPRGPGYWRGSALLVHDLGVSVAKSGRQGESLLHFWRQIVESESEVPVAWVNLGVALNQIRQWTRDPERFEMLSAIALASFERALHLYKKNFANERNGIPLGGMSDNWEVYQSLLRQAEADPARARHKAAAEAITTKLDWPALRVDRWQMRQTLEAGDGGGAGVASGGLAARKLALGLWAEGLLTARVFGWKSPRLKGESLALLRACAEVANLTVALSAAAELPVGKEGEAEEGDRTLSQSSRNALLAGLRKGGADNLLADPLLFNTMGAVATVAAREEEAASRLAAAARLRREAMGAFRLSLAVDKDDTVAKGGITELIRKHGAQLRGGRAGGGGGRRGGARASNEPRKSAAKKAAAKAKGAEPEPDEEDEEEEAVAAAAAAAAAEVPRNDDGSISLSAMMGPINTWAEVGSKWDDDDGRAAVDDDDDEEEQGQEDDEDGYDEGGEGDDWTEGLGGLPALKEKLQRFLEQQRRAAAWLAGEDLPEGGGGASGAADDEGGEAGGGVGGAGGGGEPPRILIGVMPNVGMGNQILTLVSYLAHALLTGRALFIHDTALQCNDGEWGDVPQSPGSDISLLCHEYFRLRHEGPQDGGAVLPPLWRLSAVLERSRRPGRLARFHAAFPANRANPLGRLHLYFRPNPEHQQAIERFVCAPDVPGRDETQMLAIQTTQYYIPLLQANPRLGARMRRFFTSIDELSPSSGGASASATPAPFEPDLDAFGPLFRFLLRPSAAVEAAVEKFVAEHFAGASRVLGVHIRAGIPGADNTWVNAFGRGEGGLNNFERATRKCAKQVASSLAEPQAAGAATSTAESSSGAGAGGVVAFVASDNAGMRGRTIEALNRIGGVRAVQYTPPKREPLASGQGLVGSVSRGTANGLMVAATEMMILSRCDAFVRTGSRGYSSYSYVAANAVHRAAGPPPQYLVVHPCDEDKRWPRRDGATASSPPIDCFLEQHTQPRLNMWWTPNDTPAERGRVSCALPLPDGSPSKQNLAQRLQARGVMDLQCHDLQTMYEWQKKQGMLLPPLPASRKAKTEL